MRALPRHPLLTLALLVAASGLSASSAIAQRSSAEPAPTQSATAQNADDDDLINADRPGIADGSLTVGAGMFQAEVGLQDERRADEGVRTRTRFVPTLLRLGLTDHLEARVESNTFTDERATDDAGASSSESGLASVLLGFKWTMFDSGGDARRSVGTIVRVAPPSGSNGFGTTHTTGDVRLAADWDFAPKLSLNPNVGVARYEDSDGSTFGTALGALTLTYQPTPRLNPFVDLGYQSLEEPGGTWALALDAGVAYIVGRDVQLDVSAGTRAHGVSPARPFVAIGVSARHQLFHRREQTTSH